MRKGDHLTTFIVPKVEKIQIPKGQLRSVAGKPYFYDICVGAWGSVVVKALR